jgi:hypothetical protein
MFYLILCNFLILFNITIYLSTYKVPLASILRIWDTYFSEDLNGFENFHVYVCSVFLITFRDKLIEMEFQDILMFLQDLPTISWTEEDVEPILSQAYILSKFLYVSICLCIYMSIYLYIAIYLSSTHLSISHTNIYLSIYLSIGTLFDNSPNHLS